VDADQKMGPFDFSVVKGLAGIDIHATPADKSDGTENQGGRCGFM
jgi:hypothetical protein